MIKFNASNYDENAWKKKNQHTLTGHITPVQSDAIQHILLLQTTFTWLQFLSLY